MKVVCISDTHTHHSDIIMPPGHVLVHAGDYSFMGRSEERRSFLKWLKDQPYNHKLVVPGNHDWDAFRTPELIKEEFFEAGAHLLIDESVTIEDKLFYGSPWTPEFCGWAFMYPREEGQKVWDKIPGNTYVLITHGPPHMILDRTPRGDRAGCPYLANTVVGVAPKYHIFGHIHDGYGTVSNKDTQFINAAICTESYRPTNKPIVIEV